MKKLISILFLLGIAGIIFAQEPDEVATRFMEQLARFSHEKIHVQTDKSAYLSGERVWLRSHLVEATTNMPAFLSRYVYVELFSPFDQVIQRIKIRPDSIGVYSGYLDLNEELPEGNYTIRAYTRYMRNQGNEAFFKKTIQVLDPYSLQIEPVPHFVVNGNRVNVNFKFVDTAGKDTITPDIVTFQLLDEAERRISPDGNSNFKWDFMFKGKRNNRNLLLGVVHNGRKYNKYYPIPYDTNDFDITFHPEGGYLIPGQTCQVGFKAINPSGLSEEVTGTLFNSKDEEIVQFRTLKFGMGFFNFIPQANEKYYAVCKTKRSDTKRIDLPIPDFRSRTVSARLNGENRIVVSMLKGNAAPEDPVYILIHSKGVVYFHQLWENPSRAYSFATNNFPTGIISILLLSDKNEILSERMIFNLNRNDFAVLDTELSSPAYKRRQLIRLRLRLADSDTIAFSDNMAVAVTDKNVVRQDTTNNLLSTLLLSSELKGFIESPASYFNGYAVADKYALDALMLTQGWRRYDIPEVLKGNIAVPGQFRPEEFQEVSGRSEALFGSLKEGEISLYATLDSLYSGETTTADEKGRFMFKVEYPENTEITVQSLSKKGGRGNTIHLDQETFPDHTFSTIPLGSLGAEQPTVDLDAYMKKANEEYSLKYGIRTIMLEEVTVSAPKLEKYKESMYYSSLYASGLVTAEDMEKRNYSSFRSLLVSNPSLVVSGSDKVTTTQSGKPVLFIIDGVKYEDFQIESIDISDIDNLFVLKNNLGLFTYAPNTEGAVVITTKHGFVQKNVKSLNIDRIRPLGYQLPAEFYMPAYETQEQRESSTPDLRTTIFWKPNVQFSKEGEAVVEFYSADTPTTYQLIGEGVTSAGKIIRWEKEVTVESSY
ncbi:MG2 domain-containing protein [Proteiniphilum sp. X52]|uniref:MG2 domain-containing protein n=1 Tax=Proteiniphilum sp. X52 TaxID=2382159 RepID=UPI000F0A7B9F|nr:MG2 domain-containing protein [Proteiniphilum sp. X52]RNC64123.1 hypothetical protein D7D25_12955 [Proteiniphilum sp. X52]